MDNEQRTIMVTRKPKE